MQVLQASLLSCMAYSQGCSAGITGISAILYGIFTGAQCRYYRRPCCLVWHIHRGAVQVLQASLLSCMAYSQGRSTGITGIPAIL